MFFWERGGGGAVFGHSDDPFLIAHEFPANSFSLKAK